MRERGYTLTLQNHLIQLSRKSTYIVCSAGWNRHVGQIKTARGYGHSSWRKSPAPGPQKENFTRQFHLLCRLTFTLCLVSLFFLPLKFEKNGRRYTKCFLQFIQALCHRIFHIANLCKLFHLLKELYHSCMKEKKNFYCFS